MDSFFTVNRGDTLFGIAQRLNLSSLMPFGAPRRDPTAKAHPGSLRGHRDDTRESGRAQQ